MSGFDAVLGDGLQRPRLIGEGVAPQDPEGPRRSTSSGFSSELASALRNVDGLRKASKAKAEALARGEPVEVHDIMIASAKSEVAFNLMLEVRNKLLEAWQTLERAVV